MKGNIMETTVKMKGSYNEMLELFEYDDKDSPVCVKSFRFICAIGQVNQYEVIIRHNENLRLSQKETCEDWMNYFRRKTQEFRKTIEEQINFLLPSS